MTQNEKFHQDKCDNCGEENSSQFWDYDDGSVLCDKCHGKIGDKWASLAQSNTEPKETKVHQKAGSGNVSAKKANSAKYVIGAAILIVGLLLLFSAKNIIAGGGAANPDYRSGEDNPVTGGDVASGNGEVQNVKLALVDFSYKMTPNQVKVGVPVRMEVDASTLSGCMTTVVIRDFGVSKRIRPGDNIIEFTPTKTGTFWITCGMGMGPGSFEVVKADGKSDTVANAKAAPAPASTCGGSGGGGGCGCGGG